MNILWSKIIAIIEAMVALVVISATPTPLPVPTPTPEAPVVYVEELSTPIATPSPTPTPDILQQLVELKQIIAAYTPEPTPAPVIIYVTQPTPTPAPVASAPSPTPLPATPEPTPTPEPEVKCEAPSGAPSGLVRCYSSFSEDKTIERITFYQMNNGVHEVVRPVIIRNINGEVVFNENLEAESEYEVEVNFTIHPENSSVKYYNIFSYEIGATEAQLRISHVDWE